MLSPSSIKKDFPIFAHHPELVYLDSAATALKPTCVLDAELKYYHQFSSNIARGLYPLAEQATETFEATRAKVASFIGARPDEIIFTSGTTHSLNLVADLLAPRIKRGDTIVITALEHHSNFLPWKELAHKKGAELRILPVKNDGTLDLTLLPSLLESHTSVFSLSAISNVVGLIHPLADIIRTARKINPETLIIVDAAQAVGHIPVDVVAWDADFVAFSGHKVFGPTGTGVLFGKHSLLQSLSPVAFGGGMVLDACATQTLYKESPTRFEAGTPNIAGIIGLGSAIDFIKNIGVDTIHAHEQALIAYTQQRLTETLGDKLHVVGPSETSQRSSILSFTIDDIHPHDLASLLGEESICIRAGAHCTQPLHQSLQLSASARVSVSPYNTKEDIESLITGIQKALRTLSS